MFLQNVMGKTHKIETFSEAVYVLQLQEPEKQNQSSALSVAALIIAVFT